MITRTSLVELYRCVHARCVWRDIDVGCVFFLCCVGDRSISCIALSMEPSALPLTGHRMTIGVRERKREMTLTPTEQKISSSERHRHLKKLVKEKHRCVQTICVSVLSLGVQPVCRTCSASLTCSRCWCLSLSACLSIFNIMYELLLLCDTQECR